MARKKGSGSKRKFKNRGSEGQKGDQPISEDEQVDLLKVEQSEILGRYVVAGRTLEPGEIILRDEAIIVGPCQESKPLCVGCYVSIKLNDLTTCQRCKVCSWPLCSIQCSGYHTKNGHSEGECSLLSKSLLKDRKIESFVNYYYALTPFRCLLLKETNPEMWKIIQGMEAHTKEREKSATLWAANCTMAVDVIRKDWGLSHFTESEIHFVCGVLEVNAFEVNIPNKTGEGQQCLRAIYPKSFLFAHDCVPNACYANGQNFQMIFRTLTTIRDKDLVTISYAYTLQSTLKRRQHLKKAKFFSCVCARCSDPTELGTFAGAMKCQKCGRGFVLPEDPLDNDSIWICNFSKCLTRMEVTQINPFLDGLFNQLDSIDGNDITKYEEYLRNCEKVLHENHYLCLSAMHCLSRLYGKIEGYLINDLPEELLERKVSICRRLIKIFEKLQPGLSKEKGILYYELHAPLMVLVKKKCENASISRKEMKVEIRKIVKYLEEAASILSLEPELSEERQISDVAREAIESLKQSL